jgi:putative MATE family efflux protein
MVDLPRNHVVSGSLLPGLMRLAVPMLISSVLQNAQTLIDLFWVGRLGSESVAALALSGTILMMMFPLIMGMAAGTVALVSRRVGEDRPAEAADTAGQAIGLAFGLGLVAGLLGAVAAPYFCRALGAPPLVAGLATRYLRVSFLGMFTVCVLFIGGHSVFQASGNTVIPMLIIMLSNGLNLVLDPILIFGLLGCPRLEIRGAALATIIAQATAASVAIALLMSGRKGIHVHARRLLPRPGIAFAILRIGLPGSGQMLARSLMALVLMRIVAASGTAAMAAYGIGLRFHMIILMPAFALGNAVATMVGQNLGAGQAERAHRAAWLGAAMDMGIMAVLGGLLVAFAPALVGVFDPDPAVVAIGTSFLRTTSGFFVFVALAIVLGRGLQGAGDTMSSMVCTIIALWGLQVPLAVVLSRVVDPPTQGIWWAMVAAVTVHGLLVTAWFQTGRWKRRRV